VNRYMEGEKLQTTEERFLLSAMQHGDIKAYGVLFRRYYPMLCAYATKFVELKDAEEIVQDVMLWLWENRETQTFETSISQYLFKAVYHRAINLIVRHQSQLRADTLFYENMQEMLQDTDFYQFEELQKRIRNAIQALLHRIPFFRFVGKDFFRHINLYQIFDINRNFCSGKSCSCKQII